MMDLNGQYVNGSMSPMPQPGRYDVEMLIKGAWTVVLRKQIFDWKRGSNYLPVSILKYFKIPCMDFSISPNLSRSEIIFTYQNGLLIDTLRHLFYNTWIGKMYYKGVFIDFFKLKKR